MRLTWIYGPPAAGKSVTAWALYAELAATGTACASLDIDQVGICFPEPDDDPGRYRLKARALAALAAVREREGCRHLVVSGVMDPALRPWHDEVLAAHDVRWCRLAAPDDELTRRLADRGPWGEDPAGVLAAARELDAAGLPDPVVRSGDGRSVAEVAADVAAVVGWGDPDATGVATTTGARAVVPATGPGPDPRAAASAVWLAGRAASGRSTVGWAAFQALLSRGPAAFLDAQQLGFVSGVDERTRREAPAAGVAAVWPVLAAAGARALVIAGARDQGSVPPQDVLAPTPVQVVLLEASAQDVAARVAARARGEGVRLAGDDLVGLSPQEQAAVVARATSGPADDLPAGARRVDTSGRTPADVAREVLQDVVDPAPA